MKHILFILIIYFICYMNMSALTLVLTTTFLIGTDGIYGLVNQKRKRRKIQRKTITLRL